MSKQLSRWAFMALCGLLTASQAACGSATDPGSGTKTLLALIEVQATGANSQVEVELTANGNPVIGANVAFTHQETGRQHTAESVSAGNYRVIIDGYARTLAVKITAGNDELKAQLQGPAKHSITRPSNDSRVRRGSFATLKVTWEAEEPAESVVLKANQAAPVTLNGDPFSAEIPLGELENGPVDLSIIRETTVNLAGGVTGSQMRTRYQVDNRFSLE